MLQSHILEFATDLPFDRAMVLLQTALPEAEVNSSQSQRLMQYFGNLAQTEEILTTPGPGFQVEEPCKEVEEAPDKVLYVEVDGGHLRTDEGYRKTKVGRIFSDQHRIKKSSDDEQVIRRMELEFSDYLAHLGSHHEFSKRFDLLIENHLRLAPGAQMVAIGDGAEWIAAWLAYRHPLAIVILDFYHAIEHLADFATLVFDSQESRNAWIEAQKKNLLSGSFDQVLEAIRKVMVSGGVGVSQKAEQLLKYYGN